MAGSGRETDYKLAGPRYPELHLRNWCICCSRWEMLARSECAVRWAPGAEAWTDCQDANRLRRNYTEISLEPLRELTF